MKNNKADKNFETMLEDAARMADERIGKEFIEPQEDIVFEKEDEMLAFFHNERSRKKHKTFAKYVRVAAGLLLVLAVAGGVSVYNVEAWRMKILDFVFEFGEPNSDYDYSDLGGTSYADDDISLNYLPEGFELNKKEKTETTISYTFSDGERSITVCKEVLDEKTKAMITKANGEKLKIRDFDGKYIKNDNIKSVVWASKYRYYTIIGKGLEKIELLMIAEKCT